ncbi:MAG: phage holin family protein [Acidobacteria bacterium]|nr:phage holin family protein [Acidobacteriota bacterium]
MASAPDSRSLGELFSDLTREITTLVRAEIALARVEMGAKVSRAARHAGAVAFGGVIALGGLLTLIAALVLILVRVGLPAWSAALLVGLSLASVGAMLATRGLAALRAEDLAPTETIRTIKETTTWKDHTAS